MSNIFPLIVNMMYLCFIIHNLDHFFKLHATDNGEKCSMLKIFVE